MCARESEGSLRWVTAMRIQLPLGVGLSTEPKTLSKGQRPKKAMSPGAMDGVHAWDWVLNRTETVPPYPSPQPQHQHQATRFNVQWELHTKIQFLHQSRKGNPIFRIQHPLLWWSTSCPHGSVCKLEDLLHGGKPRREQCSKAAHVLNETHEHSRTTGPAGGKLWRFC